MTLLQEKPRRSRDSRPRMTEDEFVSWAMADEFTRAEWVDGEVIIMSPVSLDHVRLTKWFVRVIDEYVEYHDLGEMFGPEYMVRFSQLKTRRVPDVLSIAKKRMHLLQKNHFEGAPDLIIEIVSPDSVSRDWREKYEQYEKSGVREYWIVDPLSRRAEAYALSRGKRYQRISEKDGALHSHVIRGLWLKTEWFWPETRPAVLTALKLLGIR